MSKLFLVIVSICSCVLLMGEELELVSRHQVKTEDGRVFYTGRVTPPKSVLDVGPSLKYLMAAGPFPKTLNRDLSKLSEILDQGPCGSCVYHGCSSSWMDTMILKGMPYLRLSPKYMMDCAARDWGCEGSFAQKYWDGAVAKGGAALEKDYPYSPQQAHSCTGSPKLYGKILSYKIIDNSAKSSIAALNDRNALAVTIGAGGAFMNYKSGVFSACSSVPTNHQVEVVDYNCETAVDAAGNCVFDASGNLPKGVGYWVMRNSWGVSWGDKGWIKIKMTDSNGRKCNNIMEEVSVPDVGAPTPPPGPQVFDMESPAMSLKVTLACGTVVCKVSVDEAKAIIQPFLDSLK